MKILITGDISDWNIANFSIKSITPLFQNIIKEADICIYNLEGPIAVNNHVNDMKISLNPVANLFWKFIISAAGKKQPLVISTTNILTLCELNPNTILTLANNHIKDLGNEGLENTINLLESNGIKAIGAGLSSLMKYSIHLTEKIIVLNINLVGAKKYGLPLYLYNARWHGFGAAYLSYAELKTQIKQYQTENKKVILIVHAGKVLPSNIESSGIDLNIFRSLDADIVVIHHIHQYLSGEWEIDNIFMLGDFIFNHPNHLPSTRKSAALIISYENEVFVPKIIPFSVNEVYQYEQIR